MSFARVASPITLMALGAALSKNDFLVGAATTVAVVAALLVARAVAVRVNARVGGKAPTR